MSIGNHTVMVHLAPELRSGVIKYMAKHDLDKEYAVLSLLVKAMRSEGIITQEAYEVYASRYGKTVSSLSSPLNSKQLSKAELDTKQKLDEKARYFSMVLDQWQIHGSDWRRKKLVEAEEWRDRVLSANLVLDLGVER